MRQIPLFIIVVIIIALTCTGTSNATNQDSGQSQPTAQPPPTSKVLPPDQPTTLQECLKQTLFMNDPLQDWRYMAVCALRFPKVERDAFEVYVQPNDPATPVRVGNIIRNGMSAANFLEKEATRHVQMPQALKGILGYWRVDHVDFRRRAYGDNFIAEFASEAFTLFPHVSTVVDHIEGFGFNRKDRGECIVVVPIDEGSPIAWTKAFYATTRHYGIRGRIAVDDATLQILTQGLRKPRVLASKQGPEPVSMESYRNTWHLVQLP